jgi:hypothetical protein
MTATAADVVTAARALLGTPFQHQCRSPGVALDCAGVVICTARAVGAVAPEFDVTGYRRLPDGVSLRAYCDAHLRAVAAPRVGGVVLVSMGPGRPHHLGIVVPYAHGNALAMVHAESQRHRSVIETRLMFGATMRLQGAYVIPGVA